MNKGNRKRLTSVLSFMLRILKYMSYFLVFKKLNLQGFHFVIMGYCVEFFNPFWDKDVKWQNLEQVMCEFWDALYVAL